ncbi:hypothetical protein, partial [Nonomuraea dietziae]|uniref:hypothetical protein n=1 Tax=Nonomuraea dietziae TaxID=65515 RepID=UPI003415BB67
ARSWVTAQPRAATRRAGHRAPAEGRDSPSTVRLWDTDPERVAGRVCALAHPRITRAQWARHIPGVPYRPPCG